MMVRPPVAESSSWLLNFAKKTVGLYSGGLEGTRSGTPGLKS